MLQNPATCGIDWAAWGTWAAVIVALWIAFRDMRRLGQQRKVASHVLAARALPLLGIWKRYLAAIDANVNEPTDEIDMYTAMLAAGGATRTDLRTVGSEISVQGIDALLEAWSSADAELTGMLATAAAQLEILKSEAMRPAGTPAGETFRGAEEFMVQFRAILSKARATVGRAENTCRKY